MPEILSLKLTNVIDEMVNFWDEAGRPYNWLSGNGNLEDNLQGLLATSDCCIPNKSMNSIMRLQLFSDTNSEFRPVLMSKLVWNPPVINFEDLQTVAVEGSRFRLKPSCSFFRIQASQSCIQYHIQTDSCWLHWNSDTRLYEGIVPSYPVQVASQDCYEISYVMTAVITTSLPNGVIFERNVRCQFRLKIIPANSPYKTWKIRTNFSNSKALLTLSKTRNYTDLINFPRKDYLKNFCDGDNGIERPRKPFANRKKHLDELESGSCYHGDSTKPYQRFEDLHNSPPKMLLDRDSLLDGNKLRRAEKNVVETLEPNSQLSNLLKRRNYAESPLPRTPKRIKCRKQNRMFKHSQSERRGNCSQTDPRSNKFYRRRWEISSSENLDTSDFPSPYAHIICLDMPLKKKAERFAYTLYQEEKLDESEKENISETISKDYLSEARSGAYKHRSNDGIKQIRISQHIKARNVASRRDSVLLNGLSSDVLLKRELNSERCHQLTASMSTGENQLKLRGGSSGNSDEMSVSTCCSTGINYSRIPDFPESVSASSGSSSSASIFTKSELGFNDCDNDYIEQVDYVNSKELSDSSSSPTPPQAEYVYNSDTSADEYFTQQLPQQMVSASINDCSLTNSLNTQNKKMRDITKNNSECSANSPDRQRIPPDSRPIDAWPMPVTAGHNSSSPVDTKQEVKSNRNNLWNILSQPQFQLENDYRCDTPMIEVTQDASTSCRSSCRAYTPPSQDAIARLQKEYQDNYEYFSSLKARNIQGTNHHPVGNKNDKIDKDGDATENMVYENIFLETDVAPGEKEIS